MVESPNELLCLGGTLLLALLILTPFSATRSHHKALRHQARQDYEAARGTQHLRLLRDARTRLQETHAARLREYAGAFVAWKRVDEEQDRALRRALYDHLVDTRLTEIPGIGAALQLRLRQTVYLGSLNDLRGAYRAPGVGESRQRQINSWIEHYEARVPELLKTDFPQKQAALQRYSPQLIRFGGEVERLRAELRSLDAKLEMINSEIARLEAVTEEDFFRALLSPSSEDGRLAAYLKGSFAEWEAVPEWLREITREVGPSL